MNKIDILKKCLQELDYIDNIDADSIKSVTIDSREVEKDTLFFAINKGNNYVKEVLDKGGIVITDAIENRNINNKNIVNVKDTVVFIQYFAKEWRKSISTKIIGITGSNGKTSVKDILALILDNGHNNVLKTYKNYNNQIGVPLTLLQINKEHEFAIIEMGTSEVGEIAFLSSMVRPDYSIITNIGNSHLMNFKTKESVYYEKMRIIDYTNQKTVVDIRDEYLHNLYKDERVVKANDGKNFFSKLEIVEDKMLFDLNIEGYRFPIITNLIGEHYALNILLAMTMANLLIDIDIENIQRKLMNIKLSDMRMEIININGSTIINDAYNSNPNSLNMSLKTFDTMYKRATKMVVIGSMLELGKDSKKLHEAVAFTLLQTNIELVILYGKETKCIEEYIVKNKFPIKVMYIEPSQQFIRDVYKISDDNEFWLLGNKDISTLQLETGHKVIAKYLTEAMRDIKNVKILLKGSRGMKLENIVKIIKEEIK